MINIHGQSGNHFTDIFPPVTKTANTDEPQRPQFAGDAFLFHEEPSGSRAGVIIILVGNLLIHHSDIIQEGTISNILGNFN